MPVQVTETPVAPLKVATAQSVASELKTPDIGLIDPATFSKEQATQLVTPAEQAQITALANSLINFDQTNPREKAKRTASVEGIGSAAQLRASETSKMLDQPIRALAQAGEEGNPVANALVGLNTQVNKINPARFKLLEPGGFNRFLSYIPGVGKTVSQYFAQFQNASTMIESVLLQLKAGTERLKRDNETIVDDKVRMAEVNVELLKVIARALYLDKVLEERSEAMVADSEERKFLDEEIRFPLRQRIKDLQTQLAVNQQGILSLEIVRRNNLELIRGARRCEVVTFTALKIAVQVALALANQRIVLRTIEAVDATTNDLMLQNANTLRTQGTAIHKQAVNQGISIETLKKSFDDIQAAYDDLSAFRQQALPEMRAQMTELSRLTGDAAKTIERVEKGASARTDILETELAPAN